MSAARVEHPPGQGGAFVVERTHEPEHRAVATSVHHLDPAVPHRVVDPPPVRVVDGPADPANELRVVFEVLQHEPQRRMSEDDGIVRGEFWRRGPPIRVRGRDDLHTDLLRVGMATERIRHGLADPRPLRRCSTLKPRVVVLSHFDQHHVPR